MKPPADLRHVLLHFTGSRSWREGPVTVFTKGEGCYLWDEAGGRHFDALAGMFSVQIGHGRADIARAMADQAEQLAYIPSWSITTPAALEAAKLITGLAPADDLDAVFFVSSGSEAVESAIKFARQYHAARGEPGRTGVISRDDSYHGTTMGALSATGLDNIRKPFFPLLEGFTRAPNTLGYGDGPACARLIEDEIIRRGPEEVGLVIAEPVQNGGGALVPPAGYWPELRRICDEYGVLLAADEIVNAFGRLGRWFGSELVEGAPDIIAFAKGATSGYAPIGGMIVRRRLVDRVLDSPSASFLHGATWGGHPVVMAAAAANLTAMKEERVLENVTRCEESLRRLLHGLRAAHDSVMDVRGCGYFFALPLGVSRRDGREYPPEEGARLVGEVLPLLVRKAKLHIRVDGRGGPKLVVSPPLVAGPAELHDMAERISQVLDMIPAAMAADAGRPTAEAGS